MTVNDRKIIILKNLAESQGIDINEEQAMELISYCWSYEDEGINYEKEAEETFRFKDTDDMFDYMFEDYNSILIGIDNADLFYPNRLERINRDFFNGEKVDMTIKEILLSTIENIIYLGDDKYVFFYQ